MSRGPIILILALLAVARGSRMVVDAFQVVPTHLTTTRQPTTESLSSSPPASFSSAGCSSSSVLLRMARGGPSRGRRYQPVVKEVKPPMNEEITAAELRVVTPNPQGGKDEPLGIMSREEALQRAAELGDLDLILINSSSDPPVCKIVDYSKYRYMQEKKAKEVKKNSKASELKEVKMSYKIDTHDYTVRRTAAAKFLRQGNRVKCTVMFRGREVQHDQLGYELLQKLATELDDLCLSEGRPAREGRNLSWILTPRPEVLKQVNEQRRALDKAKKQKKLLAQQSGGAGEGEEADEEDKVGVAAAAAAPAKTKAEKTLEELLGTDEYL